MQVTSIEQLPRQSGWRVSGIQRSNDDNSTQDVQEEASLLVVTDPMMALPGTSSAPKGFADTFLVLPNFICQLHD